MAVLFLHYLSQLLNTYRPSTSVILRGILVTEYEEECALDTQFVATIHPTIHLHQERWVTIRQYDKKVTLLISLYSTMRRESLWITTPRELG
jgi:hypothetical protein